jgi:diadenosine tetraphosphate (Ap4A) HIT family hydrolase
MGTCLFCGSSKDLPFAVGGLVYEDDFVFAHHLYEEGSPSYLGCLLLITKRHVLDLAELTGGEAQAVGLAVARLSHALKACTGAAKIYLDAYYEVNPHLHLNLVARYPATPPEYWRWQVGHWPKAPRGGPEAIVELCEQIRAHLAQTMSASR